MQFSVPSQIVTQEFQGFAETWETSAELQPDAIHIHWPIVVQGLSRRRKLGWLGL